MTRLAAALAASIAAALACADAQAAPFLVTNIGSGEDLNVTLAGTHTPRGRCVVRLAQQIEHLGESQGWRPAPTQSPRPPPDRPAE